MIRGNVPIETKNRPHMHLYIQSQTEEGDQEEDILTYKLRFERHQPMTCQ